MDQMHGKTCGAGVRVTREKWYVHAKYELLSGSYVIHVDVILRSTGKFNEKTFIPICAWQQTTEIQITRTSTYLIS